MKITVLGCGALGQLWMTALIRQGHEVQGWLRVPAPWCSVNLQELDGHVFNELVTANDPEFLAQSDLLLVTLKAWQISTAVKNLAEILPATTPVLLIHNGMGVVEELQSLKQPLLIGMTTQAARRDQNLIIHVANGTTRIGPANALAHEYSFLADTLHSALPDVAWHNDMGSASWKKLAVNCVINPLTAIYDCPNGGLRYRAEEVTLISGEVATVMQREGHHCSAEDLLFYVWQVVDSTSANISSMLQDVRALRHTEIDYITGYLLKRARTHGITVPENARLFELIKRKENTYERNGAGLSRPWE